MVFRRCGLILQAFWWPPFFVKTTYFFHIFPLLFQAAAAWKWFNFFENENPPNKKVLRMNLDETSVCLFQGEGRGTVFCHKGKFQRDRTPYQKVTSARMRTCFTHVAFICDDVTLQTEMPQIIIANENTIKVREFEHLYSRAPRNVHLIRQKVHLRTIISEEYDEVTKSRVHKAQPM